MEHFLLIDLETTGLEPERCRVIEVAARLLEPGREIDRYHSLAAAPPAEHRDWDGMALEMHNASGLFDEARDCSKSIQDVDIELVRMIEKHTDDQVHLMGNSVHFDRGFIRRHLRRVYCKLHYRQLDVTSVRLWHILMSGKDPWVESDPRPHRAQEDIENSLRQATQMWQGR